MSHAPDDNQTIVRRLTVLVLVDNTTVRGDLLAEHGLSLWVEADDHRLLLDTGEGVALPHNVEQLGLPLERADAVVLSHGHYDHTGGLPFVLERAPSVRVFLHPAAAGARFSRCEVPPHKAIGMPSEAAAVVSGGRVTRTELPTEVVPGVWATGEVPRRTDFEDTGGPFFTDPECTAPDRIPDDQALFVRTAKGVVVLCGCAHAGVVNTLDYVAELTGKSPIYAVVGGLHLGLADAARLRRTADAMEDFGVKMLAPAHCTGEAAKRVFQQRFPDRYVGCGVGTCFILV